MSTEERNLWRHTIMAYNSGTYLKQAEEATNILHNMNNPKMINQIKAELDITRELSSWEIIRNYVHNVLCEAEKKPGTPHPDACSNLSYMEVIAGGPEEAGTGEKNSGSLIESWNQYRKSNNPVTCPTVRKQNNKADGQTAL